MASQATKLKMINHIDTVLEESQDMFDTKSQSNAYIIGYLTGTLKNLRSRLTATLDPIEQPEETNSSFLLHPRL